MDGFSIVWFGVGIGLAGLLLGVIIGWRVPAASAVSTALNQIIVDGEFSYNNLRYRVTRIGKIKE